MCAKSARLERDFRLCVCDKNALAIFSPPFERRVFSLAAIWTSIIGRVRAGFNCRRNTAVSFWRSSNGQVAIECGHLCTSDDISEWTEMSLLGLILCA